MFLISCGDKKEVSSARIDDKTPIKTEKASKPKSNKQITKEPKKETISRKNTVEFLTQYGKENPETIVLFKTRLGNLKIKLYRDTPLHRASFIFLTKEGYFSTTSVHRIVEGFVVQGGNSEAPSTRKLRRKFDAYTLPAEFRKNRTHIYGAIAAARDWDNNPNKRSTPFEFYFVQDKNGSHHLNGEHTVFGEIIGGFSTLEKIAKVKVGNDEWPIENVYFDASVIR